MMLDPYDFSPTTQLLRQVDLLDDKLDLILALLRAQKQDDGKDNKVER